MNELHPQYHVLKERQEQLLQRKNEKTDFYNGIYDRWEHPVLTREHVPVEWRFDLDPKTNPYFMERLGVNAVFNEDGLTLYAFAGMVKIPIFPSIKCLSTAIMVAPVVLLWKFTSFSRAENTFSVPRVLVRLRLSSPTVMECSSIAVTHGTNRVPKKSPPPLRSLLSQVQRGVPKP